ncbi:MAG: DegT/DnrJ/EryC1/StrS family aminotransferase, partial [Candidatus Thorarchaeota archaeon]
DHRKYWHIPLHRTQAYLSYSNRGVVPPLPITEKLADRVISLPMHDGLTPDDIKMITEVVRGAL